MVGFQRGTGFDPHDHAEAKAARACHPALGDKVRFVAARPRRALFEPSATSSGGTCSSGSDLVRYPLSSSRAGRLGDWLERWSGLLDAAIGAVHVFAAVVLIGAALRQDPRHPGPGRRARPCASYACPPDVDAGVLAGRRLILAAVPFLIVAYASLGWHLLRRSSRDFSLAAADSAYPRPPA